MTRISLSRFAPRLAYPYSLRWNVSAAEKREIGIAPGGTAPAEGVDSMQVSFVYGLKTNIEIKVDRNPQPYRRTQKDLASHVALDGWRTVVPELYAECPDASRSVEEVALRTWNTTGIGTTRLPTGLLRLVKDVAAPKTDGAFADGAWEETSSYVAIWPDGAGFVTLRYELHLAGTTNEMRSLRNHVDARREDTTNTARRVGQQTVEALVQGLEAVGFEYRQDISSPAARILGRHRLIQIEADPTSALLEAIRQDVVLIGRSLEFANVCGDDNRFCYAGFGVSVEVTTAARAAHPVLGPVLEYYEYWIAATTTIDDVLSSEFSRLSAAVQSSTYTQGDSRKNNALELFFTHQDVLNAMSPQHLAVWKSLMPTWRIPALERDIREKIAAIEELNRSLRETEANRVALWTSSLVTFLTALTLVSLITGVAAFLSASAERLAPQFRIWLVAISFLAALLLFSLSIGPVITAKRRRDAGSSSSESGKTGPASA